MMRAVIGIDIAAAARRIARLASPTPLIQSSWLSDLAGAPVWLKLEIVQPTGSFKLRGAVNAITRRLEADPGLRGVVTASAGNHGQAVAYVARELGLAARVYVPKTAPEAKRHALRRLGAETIETPTYDDAERQAHEDADRTGTPFLSPYDDDDVIAGAGTVAMEMIAERPELDTFIVPLGGGGLLAGTAIAARANGSTPVVIGVEAAASPVFTTALAAGRQVNVEVRESLADGLAGNMEPDSRTLPIVRDLVTRVVKLDEPVIARAMRELMLRERLVAEGAGAIGVAALLAGGLDVAGRHVGVILSGRNVDERVIRRVLSL
jgi:threonine dehydratase